jgi:hypothetical protein
MWGCVGEDGVTEPLGVLDFGVFGATPQSYPGMPPRRATEGPSVKAFERRPSGVQLSFLFVGRTETGVFALAAIEPGAVERPAQQQPIVQFDIGPDPPAPTAIRVGGEAGRIADALIDAVTEPLEIVARILQQRSLHP